MMDHDTIRVVNLFFGVGVAPTGPLLESVVIELIKRGHRVEVLTGGVESNKGGTAMRHSLGATCIPSVRARERPRVSGAASLPG